MDDHTARLVVGCFVEPEDIAIVTDIPNCIHPQVGKFCQECGEAIGTTKRYSIDGQEFDWWDAHEYIENLFDAEDDGQKQRFIYGVLVEDSPDTEYDQLTAVRVPVLKIRSAMARAQKLMQDKGLSGFPCLYLLTDTRRG